MDLQSNIVIDSLMQKRIEEETLQIPDYLLLAMATLCARVFPESTVYIGAQQQAVEPPALFVDFYSINTQKRLACSTGYEFGIDIAYIPQNPLSSAELSGAIFSIHKELLVMPSPVGNFTCYSKSSDFTDGIAHVTGIVWLEEKALEEDPLIQIAEQELIP